MFVLLHLKKERKKGKGERERKKKERLKKTLRRRQCFETFPFFYCCCTNLFIYFYFVVLLTFIIFLFVAILRIVKCCLSAVGCFFLFLLFYCRWYFSVCHRSLVDGDSDACLSGCVSVCVCTYHLTCGARFLLC